VNDPLERFTGLYDQYYRRVLRYALQHAAPDAAEDVASEAFLIAWRQLADLPQPPLPWLLGVARNLLRQHADKARRQRRIADQMAALTSQDDLIAWDAGEHVAERAAALDALASLPAADVEALTLVTWHGLSAAEAAAVIGCTPGTFTVRLHRARRRLSEALAAGSREYGQRPRGQPAVLAGHAVPLPPHATDTPKE
jgi:RNA polymerase sigma factor (sigma-70 family)